MNKSERVKKLPAKRKRSGVYKTCPTCNETFYLTPSRNARGEKFCSMSCRKSATETVDKVCPSCGDTFTVNKSIADRFTVCSIECRLSETVYVTCKRCGKKFTGEKGRNRHYCSEECRRPPVIKTCKNCGVEFRTVPSTDCVFCSVSCYRKYTGETSIEGINRGS